MKLEVFIREGVKSLQQLATNVSSVKSDNIMIKDFNLLSKLTNYFNFFKSRISFKLPVFLLPTQENKKFK